MKRLLPWVAVALAGVVLGAGGFWLLRELSFDSALEKQREELTRLSSELQNRETALVANQERLAETADQIRTVVGRTTALADQVLAAQGTAVERLKKVITTVRSLRDELLALPSP